MSSLMLMKYIDKCNDKLIAFHGVGTVYQPNHLLLKLDGLVLIFKV